MALKLFNRFDVLLQFEHECEIAEIYNNLGKVKPTAPGAQPKGRHLSRAGDRLLKKQLRLEELEEERRIEREQRMLQEKVEHVAAQRLKSAAIHARQAAGVMQQGQAEEQKVPVFQLGNIEDVVKAGGFKLADQSVEVAVQVVQAIRDNSKYESRRKQAQLKLVPVTKEYIDLFDVISSHNEMCEMTISLAYQKKSVVWKRLRALITCVKATCLEHELRTLFLTEVNMIDVLNKIFALLKTRENIVKVLEDLKIKTTSAVCRALHSKWDEIKNFEQLLSVVKGAERISREFAAKEAKMVREMYRNRLALIKKKTANVVEEIRKEIVKPKPSTLRDDWTARAILVESGKGNQNDVIAVWSGGYYRFEQRTVGGNNKKAHNLPPVPKPTRDIGFSHRGSTRALPRCFECHMKSMKENNRKPMEEVAACFRKDNPAAIPPGRTCAQHRLIDTQVVEEKKKQRCFSCLFVNKKKVSVLPRRTFEIMQTGKNRPELGGVCPAHDRINYKPMGMRSDSWKPSAYATILMLTLLKPARAEKASVEVVENGCISLWWFYAPFIFYAVLWLARKLERGPTIVIYLLMLLHGIEANHVRHSHSARYKRDALMLHDVNTRWVDVEREAEWIKSFEAHNNERQHKRVGFMLENMLFTRNHLISANLYRNDSEVLGAAIIEFTGAALSIIEKLPVKFVERNSLTLNLVLAQAVAARFYRSVTAALQRTVREKIREIANMTTLNNDNLRTIEFQVKAIDQYLLEMERRGLNISSEAFTDVNFLADLSREMLKLDNSIWRTVMKSIEYFPESETKLTLRTIGFVRNQTASVERQIVNEEIGRQEVSRDATSIRSEPGKAGNCYYLEYTPVFENGTWKFGPYECEEDSNCIGFADYCYDPVSGCWAPGVPHLCYREQAHQQDGNGADFLNSIMVRPEEEIGSATNLRVKRSLVTITRNVYDGERFHTMKFDEEPRMITAERMVKLILNILKDNMDANRFYRKWIQTHVLHKRSKRQLETENPSEFVADAVITKCQIPVDGSQLENYELLQKLEVANKQITQLVKEKEELEEKVRYQDQIIEQWNQQVFEKRVSQSYQGYAIGVIPGAQAYFDVIRRAMLMAAPIRESEMDNKAHVIQSAVIAKIPYVDMPVKVKLTIEDNAKITPDSVTSQQYIGEKDGFIFFSWGGSKIAVVIDTTLTGTSAKPRLYSCGARVGLLPPNMYVTPKGEIRLVKFESWLAQGNEHEAIRYAYVKDVTNTSTACTNIASIWFRLDEFVHRLTRGNIGGQLFQYMTPFELHVWADRTCIKNVENKYSCVETPYPRILLGGPTRFAVYETNDTVQHYEIGKIHLYKEIPSTLVDRIPRDLIAFRKHSKHGFFTPTEVDTHPFYYCFYIITLFFLSWYIANRLGALVGIFFFLGMSGVPVAWGDQCNLDAVVLQAKQVSEDNVRRVFSVSGNFIAGACVQVGESMIRVDSITQEPKYTFIGAVPLTVDLHSASKHKCPTTLSQDDWKQHCGVHPVEGYPIVNASCGEECQAMSGAGGVAITGCAFLNPSAIKTEWCSQVFDYADMLQVYELTEVESNTQVKFSALKGNNVANFQATPGVDISALGGSIRVTNMVSTGITRVKNLVKYHEKYYASRISLRLSEVCYSTDPKRPALWANPKCAHEVVRISGADSVIDWQSSHGRTWFGKDIYPIEEMFGDTPGIEIIGQKATMKQPVSRVRLDLTVELPPKFMAKTLCNAIAIMSISEHDCLSGNFKVNKLELNIRVSPAHCILEVHLDPCTVIGGSEIDVDQDTKQFEVHYVCGLFSPGKIVLTGSGINETRTLRKACRDPGYFLTYTYKQVFQPYVGEMSGVSNVFTTIGNFFGSIGGTLRSFMSSIWARVGIVIVAIVFILCGLFLVQQGNYGLSAMCVLIAAVIIGADFALGQEVKVSTLSDAFDRYVNSLGHYINYNGYTRVLTWLVLMELVYIIVVSLVQGRYFNGYCLTVVVGLIVFAYTSGAHAYEECMLMDYTTIPLLPVLTYNYSLMKFPTLTIIFTGIFLYSLVRCGVLNFVIGCMLITTIVSRRLLAINSATLGSTLRFAEGIVGSPVKMLRVDFKTFDTNWCPLLATCAYAYSREWHNGLFGILEVFLFRELAKQLWRISFEITLQLPEVWRSYRKYYSYTLPLMTNAVSYFLYRYPFKQIEKSVHSRLYMQNPRYPTIGSSTRQRMLTLVDEWALKTVIVFSNFTITFFLRQWEGLEDPGLLYCWMLNAVVVLFGLKFRYCLLVHAYYYNKTHYSSPTEAVEHRGHGEKCMVKDLYTRAVSGKLEKTNRGNVPLMCGQRRVGYYFTDGESFLFAAHCCAEDVPRECVVSHDVVCVGETELWRKRFSSAQRHSFKVSTKAYSVTGQMNGQSFTTVVAKIQFSQKGVVQVRQTMKGLSGLTVFVGEKAFMFNMFLDNVGWYNANSLKSVNEWVLENGKQSRLPRDDTVAYAVREGKLDAQLASTMQRLPVNAQGAIRKVVGTTTAQLERKNLPGTSSIAAAVGEKLFTSGAMIKKSRYYDILGPRQVKTKKDLLASVGLRSMWDDIEHLSDADKDAIIKIRKEYSKEQHDRWARYLIPSKFTKYIKDFKLEVRGETSTFQLLKQLSEKLESDQKLKAEFDSDVQKYCRNGPKIDDGDIMDVANWHTIQRQILLDKYAYQAKTGMEYKNKGAVEDRMRAKYPQMKETSKEKIANLLSTKLTKSGDVRSGDYTQFLKKLNAQIHTPQTKFSMQEDEEVDEDFNEGADGWARETDNQEAEMQPAPTVLRLPDNIHEIRTSVHYEGLTCETREMNGVAIKWIIPGDVAPFSFFSTEKVKTGPVVMRKNDFRFPLYLDWANNFCTVKGRAEQIPTYVNYVLHHANRLAKAYNTSLVEAYRLIESLNIENDKDASELPIVSEELLAAQYLLGASNPEKKLEAIGRYNNIRQPTRLPKTHNWHPYALTGNKAGIRAENLAMEIYGTAYVSDQTAAAAAFSQKTWDDILKVFAIYGRPSREQIIDAIKAVASYTVPIGLHLDHVLMHDDDLLCAGKDGTGLHLFTVYIQQSTLRTQAVETVRARDRLGGLRRLINVRKITTRTMLDDTPGEVMRINEILEADEMLTPQMKFGVLNSLGLTGCLMEMRDECPSWAKARYHLASFVPASVVPTITIFKTLQEVIPKIWPDLGINLCQIDHLLTLFASLATCENETGMLRSLMTYLHNHPRVMEYDDDCDVESLQISKFAKFWARKNLLGRWYFMNRTEEEKEAIMNLEDRDLDVVALKHSIDIHYGLKDFDLLLTDAEKLNALAIYHEFINGRDFILSDEQIEQIIRDKNLGLVLDPTMEVVKEIDVMKEEVSLLKPKITYHPSADLWAQKLEQGGTYQGKLVEGMMVKTNTILVQSGAYAIGANEKVTLGDWFSDKYVFAIVGNSLGVGSACKTPGYGFISADHVMNGRPLYWTAPTDKATNLPSQASIDHFSTMKYPTAYSDKVLDRWSDRNVPIPICEHGEICAVVDVLSMKRMFLMAINSGELGDEGDEKVTILTQVLYRDNEWHRTCISTRKGMSGSQIYGYDGKPRGVYSRVAPAKQEVGLEPGALVTVVPNDRLNSKFEFNEKAIKILASDEILHILTAQTGSGKTIFFTWALVEQLCQNGRALHNIVLVLPTRASVRNAYSNLKGAHFNDERKGWQYCTLAYRLGKQTEKTGNGPVKLNLMTYGSFINDVASSRLRYSNDVIIMDECHTQQPEVVLAVHSVSKLDTKYHKCILMSATVPKNILDLQSSYLKWDVAANRRYEVTFQVMTEGEHKFRFQNFDFVIPTQALACSDGNVLIFLPTIAAVEEVADEIQAGTGDVKVVKCHSKAHGWEQWANISQGIIYVATNIVESSVTLSGIVTVIDSQLVNCTVSTLRTTDRYGAYYEYKNIIRECTQAEHIQRAGRTGRVCNGTVYTRVPVEQLPVTHPLSEDTLYINAAFLAIRTEFDTQHKKTMMYPKLREFHEKLLLRSANYRDRMAVARLAGLVDGDSVGIFMLGMFPVQLWRRQGNVPIGFKELDYWTRQTCDDMLKVKWTHRIEDLVEGNTIPGGDLYMESQFMTYLAEQAMPANPQQEAPACEDCNNPAHLNFQSAETVHMNNIKHISDDILAYLANGNLQPTLRKINQHITAIDVVEMMYKKEKVATGRKIVITPGARILSGAARAVAAAQRALGNAEPTEIQTGLATSAALMAVVAGGCVSAWITNSLGMAADMYVKKAYVVDEERFHEFIISREDADDNDLCASRKFQAYLAKLKIQFVNFVRMCEARVRGVKTDDYSLASTFFDDDTKTGSLDWSGFFSAIVHGFEQAWAYVVAWFTTYVWPYLSGAKALLPAMQLTIGSTTLNVCGILGFDRLAAALSAPIATIIVGAISGVALICNAKAWLITSGVSIGIYFLYDLWKRRDEEYNAIHSEHGTLWVLASQVLGVMFGRTIIPYFGLQAAAATTIAAAVMSNTPITSESTKNGVAAGVSLVRRIMNILRAWQGGINPTLVMANATEIISLLPQMGTKAWLTACIVAICIIVAKAIVRASLRAKLWKAGDLKSRDTVENLEQEIHKKMDMAIHSLLTAGAIVLDPTSLIGILIQTAVDWWTIKNYSLKAGFCLNVEQLAGVNPFHVAIINLGRLANHFIKTTSDTTLTSMSVFNLLELLKQGFFSCGMSAAIQGLFPNQLQFITDLFAKIRVWLSEKVKMAGNTIGNAVAEGALDSLRDRCWILSKIVGPRVRKDEDTISVQSFSSHVSTYSTSDEDPHWPQGFRIRENCRHMHNLSQETSVATFEGNRYRVMLELVWTMAHTDELTQPDQLLVYEHCVHYGQHYASVYENQVIVSALEIEDVIQRLDKLKKDYVIRNLWAALPDLKFQLAYGQPSKPVRYNWTHLLNFMPFGHIIESKIVLAGRGENLVAHPDAQRIMGRCPSCTRMLLFLNKKTLDVACLECGNVIQCGEYDRMVDAITEGVAPETLRLLLVVCDPSVLSVYDILPTSLLFEEAVERVRAKMTVIRYPESLVAPGNYGSYIYIDKNDMSWFICCQNYAKIKTLVEGQGSFSSFCNYVFRGVDYVKKMRIQDMINVNEHLRRLWPSQSRESEILTSTFADWGFRPEPGTGAFMVSQLIGNWINFVASYKERNDRIIRMSQQAFHAQRSVLRSKLMLKHLGDDLTVDAQEETFSDETLVLDPPEINFAEKLRNLEPAKRKQIQDLIDEGKYSKVTASLPRHLQDPWKKLIFDIMCGWEEERTKNNSLPSWMIGLEPVEKGWGLVPATVPAINQGKTLIVDTKLLDNATRQVSSIRHVGDWDKVKHLGRSLVPRRLEREEQPLASRAQIKFMDLYNLTGFAAEAKHMFDPMCGLGGAITAVLDINKSRKIKITFSTLIQEGHRLPQIFYPSGRNQEDDTHFLVFEGTKMDIRDPVVLNAYAQYFKRERSQPDFILLDAWERSNNVYEEAAWLNTKLHSTGLSFMDAYLAIKNFLAKGGSMLVKLLTCFPDHLSSDVADYVNNNPKKYGEFTRMTDFMTELCRGFTKVSVVKSRYTSYASREVYIHLQRYRPDKPPKDTFDGKKIVTWIYDMQCRSALVFLRLLRRYADGHRAAIYSQIPHPSPTYKLSSRVKPIVDKAPDIGFPDYSINISGKEEIFQSRIHEMLLVFLKQRKENFGRETVIHPPRGRFENLREIGTMRRTVKYAQFHDTTDYLCSQLAWPLLGLNALNCAVGRNDISKESVDAAIKKRLDVMPEETDDSAIDAIIKLWDASRTPIAQELKGQMRPFTFDQIHYCVNPQGAAGISEAYSSIGDFLKRPDAKKIVEDAWEALLRGEGYVSPTTVREKKETKKNKISDDNGELILDKSQFRTDEEFKKALAEGQRCVPRQIQYTDVVTRILDIMMFGPRILFSNTIAKLDLGSVTGTPPQKIGGLMSACWNFYANDMQKIPEDVRIRAWMDAKNKIEQLESSKGATAVVMDYSRFDSTINIFDLYCEYRDMCYYYPQQYHVAIKRMFEARMFLLCINDHGDIFCRKGQRSSGDQLTSVYNTKHNDVFARFYLQRSTGMSPKDVCQIRGTLNYDRTKPLTDYDWEPFKHLKHIVLKHEPRVNTTRTYYMTQVCNFCDGDDYYGVGMSTQMKLMAANAPEFAERYVKKLLRSGTSTGVKLCSSFKEVDFCSHSYYPVRVDGKCWYLPVRPLPVLFGKLLKTMKHKCSKAENYEVLVAKDNEAVGITRSRLVSALLAYPHIKSVRRFCLAGLSVIGDGRLIPTDSWKTKVYIRDYTNFENAVRSIYHVDSLHKIGYVEHSWEAKSLYHMKQNAAKIGYVKSEKQKLAGMLRVLASLGANLNYIYKHMSKKDFFKGHLSLIGEQDDVDKRSC